MNIRHGVRCIVAILPVLVVGACTAEPPAVDLAAEEAELHAAGDALVAAEMARDADAALAHYAGDAVALPAGMPMVQGGDAMRELYGEFFALPFEFSSDRTHASLSADGSMAWEYGTNTFTAEDGTTLTGKYLAVWEKVDGAWKVRAVSFSDDAPPPAAPADTTTQ